MGPQIESTLLNHVNGPGMWFLIQAPLSAMGRLLLWVGLETVCSCLVEPAGKITASSQNRLFKKLLPASCTPGLSCTRPPGANSAGVSSWASPACPAADGEHPHPSILTGADGEEPTPCQPHCGSRCVALQLRGRGARGAAGSARLGDARVKPHWGC